jgi:hypothetical protein
MKYLEGEKDYSKRLEPFVIVDKSPKIKTMFHFICRTKMN